MNPDASVNQAHLYFSMPDDNRGDGGEGAEWNQLIGSHQQGITKSTCHPLGSSNTARGLRQLYKQMQSHSQTNFKVNYFCKVKVTLQFINSECLQYFN